MNDIYYVYGFGPHVRDVARSRPEELASVTFDELQTVVAQARALGYKDVFARTKPLSYVAYRHDRPL
jgi:hypothetical protein